MWQKKYVRIHSIHKRVGKMYLDDLLLLARFWSVHTMNTLLSHEATGEDLWMAVTRRRSPDDKMVYVVRPYYTYTYYIERTLFGRKVITYKKKTNKKNYSTEYVILDAAKITIWHSVFFFPLNKYARMHCVFQSVAWHCVFTDEQLIIHQFSASQSGSVHNKCCSTNSISVSLFSVWVALMCI